MLSRAQVRILTALRDPAATLRHVPVDIDGDHREFGWWLERDGRREKVNGPAVRGLERRGLLVAPEGDANVRVLTGQGDEVAAAVAEHGLEGLCGVALEVRP